MTPPLVPRRCNPHPITQSVMADDEGILVDASEVALLTDLIREGSGFTYEHLRQQPETP